MMGHGVDMLRELLASIRMQTFMDYEILVSDNGDVVRLVEEMMPTMYPNDGRRDSIFGAKLVKGKEGAAANLNNAIAHACGNIIKPMFQDDKFMEPDSLRKIADAFETGAEWIACTSHNEGLENYNHVPRVHTSLQSLREGENTYGSPSAMAWRRNDLKFDENLKWLFDCEFYARMCAKYGAPRFVDTKIFIRQWEGQATRILADGHTRILDHNEVVEKYRDRGGLART